MYARTLYILICVPARAIVSEKTSPAGHTPLLPNTKSLAYCETVN
jgi:hypothetical protein